MKFLRSSHFLRRFVLLTVALSTKIAWAEEPSRVEKPPAIEKVIYKSPDGDEPVISDAAVMCRFNHRGYDRAVYKSSEYIKKGQGAASSAQLKAYTFYVNPLVMIEREELREAFEKKRLVSPGDANLYEMTFRVLLLDDELKQAAAKAVNEQFEGAGLTAGNISVLPYKFIEITCADQSGERISIGSYPDPSVSRVYGVADRPNNLKVNVRGSVSFLATLSTTEGHLGANFLVSGFSIKQNVVSASLYNLVQLGYSRFLDGQADWKLLQSTSSSGGGASFNVGPIGLGYSTNEGQSATSNPCWVSRNQLRTVVQESFGRMNLSRWTEFKTDSEAQNSVIDFIEKEIVRRSTTVDARIDKVGDDWKIQDAALQGDFAPTVLAKLNDNIKARTNLKNKESTKIPSVGEHERETDFVNDTDITWSTEGNLTVPKSIQLVNVHKSAFRDFASMSFTETVASHDAINEVFQGAVRHWKETRKVTRDVPTTKPSKLEVWMDHFDGKLYVVKSPVYVNTDLNPDKNNTYKSWCIPFDQTRYKALKQSPVIAAHDKHIYVHPEQYGLPTILQQWANIMNDEYWFIYDYLEDTTEKQQVDEFTDAFE